MTFATADTPMNATSSERRRYVAESILPRLDPRPMIDGAFVDARSDEVRQVRDPFSGGVLLEMPDCGRDDVDHAVAAARAAFDDGRWSGLDSSTRATHLRRLADLIEAHHDELALLESSDVGKPVAGTSAWDISNAAMMYRYYADLGERLATDEEIPGSARAYRHREPVGVVAALVPWNFPFPCISWKLGPALAMGCCVVLKSAERAPLSAQLLGELVIDAGFPPGVVNIVMGSGATAGAALVSDERIDAITFTGGSETASALVRSSAVRLPRLTLELGGKGANVVWSDADFDAAVAGTVTGMFDVAGQNCCAASRTFVHDDIADAFIAAVVEATAQRRLGDPLDDATRQGPQIDPAHVRRIDGYVQEARGQGARVLTGGGTPDELGGNFYAPTVIEGATPEMRVSREEVFGPVGCVFRVGDLDTAIARANDTPYGLSSSVWASEEDVLERFVRESRVGACWVNTFGLFDPEVPWGGTKMSGYGRELGEEAVLQFTVPKSVYWERPN
jgi:acyl-CoA reductase-like NAD-dependent aldehyde dehydrogenase